MLFSAVRETGDDKSWELEALPPKFIQDELRTAIESNMDMELYEAAVEREGDEVLEGMGVSGQHEIRMIKAALERMDAGEYGYCVKCGETISEDRLEVLPCTPFCRKCAT